MSLLLLFHPRAGGTPPTPTVRYDGWRQQNRRIKELDEDDEEMFSAAAAFITLIKH